MSSFTSPLCYEAHDNGVIFRLTSAFSYYTDLVLTDEQIGATRGWLRRGVVPETENKRVFIDVPANYITDLASIPQVVQSLIPVNGPYSKAAVIHDFLYTYNIVSKTFADDVFYEAMGVLNVGWLKKRVVYNAVKFFGGAAYKDQRVYDWTTGGLLPKK
jgi:hypothetical protein